MIEEHEFEEGNQIALQLVTDGMAMLPSYPNFLDARDAILLADLVNNDGNNLDELWAGFAKRGMGCEAYSPPNGSSVGVVEDFDTCPCTPPVVGNGTLSGSTFSFVVSGPISGESWKVYKSDDLSQWDLTDDVTLENGSVVFEDTTVNGVTKRFYKLSNGECCSRVIGFTRLTVPGNGAYWLIANQLDAPPNTLSSLFGNTLPNNTVVKKWDGSAFVDYTWSSGAWSPNGTETLSPGEGAMVQNNSANSFTFSFVGLVKEGSLVNPIAVGQYIYSSMIPQGGSLSGDLGFAATPGDQILRWNGSSYSTHNRVSFGTGWTPTQPVIGVGEAIFIKTTVGQSWNRTVSFCE